MACRSAAVADARRRVPARSTSGRCRGVSFVPDCMHANYLLTGTDGRASGQLIPTSFLGRFAGPLVTTNAEQMIRSMSMPRFLLLIIPFAVLLESCGDDEAPPSQVSDAGARDQEAPRDVIG